MIKYNFNDAELNILGETWNIHYVKTEEEWKKYPIFKDFEALGYTDPSNRSICVLVYQDDNPNNMEDPFEIVKKTIRHEIIHAFLFESGLGHNSLDTDCWALNEEMVDWFAYQWHKIDRAIIDAYQMQMLDDEGGIDDED